MDEIPLLLFLLLLSGLTSGAEIALFSTGAEKIQALKNKASNKRKLATIQRLEILKTDPEKLLVTILIVNNVVNVASSAVATVMAQEFAASHGFGDNEALILGIVTGVMTFMILVFGEIMPKSISARHALKISLAITPVVSTVQFLLYPIILPLSKFTKKFSGGDEMKHGLSEEELKAALELSEKEGKIEHDEREWVEKIFEFGEHTVETIMTPRSKIFALEDDTVVNHAIAAIQEANHSRVPIYHEDLDQVVGVLSIHAILDKYHEQNFDTIKVANLPLRSPFKIPTTMKIDTLLHEFQIEKTHMALVYDEHGGLVGLITMEDVLEEIFGEIQDEQDEEETHIHQSGKFALTCSGDTELERIEEFIQEKFSGQSPDKFPWSLEDENKSVGLFFLEQTEKFPEVGEKITLETLHHSFILKIRHVEEEHIEEVELSFSKL